MKTGKEIQKEKQRQVGLLIKQAREKLGKTQKDLSSLVRTTQPHIANIEAGKCDASLTMYRKIIEALNGQIIIKI